mgnify:FL=1
MLKFRFALFVLLLFAAQACVKPKIYKAEVATRQGAENREKVLVKELLDRKTEAANLIKQVGDLNRLIGNQEETIRELQAELLNRTQQMGESSSKLASEKMALEKELAAKNALLLQRNNLLEKVQKAQGGQKKALEGLRDALAQTYSKQQDVTVVVDKDRVVLSLPDKSLFDSKGIDISASGRALLAPLAQILASMPELDAEVICHTDNVLPKDKSLEDTWDWSLRRATNTVRMLIREFNVNANQLTPVGRGEYYPVTSNASAEGRQKNRRTEVVLYPDVPAIPSVE